uniref:ABC transmembrane type-1 domain-containing protein n=1 Tax=Strigamia maritima TaxID=126957 RepID=T1ILP5_STRMM
MLRRWRQDDIPRTSIVSLDRTIRLAVSSRITEKKTNSSFVSACKVVRNGSWMEITFFIFGCFLAVVNGICGWPVLFYFTASFAQDISDILINKLLHQNMNWFNTKTQGELISTISKSSGLVQTALGDKLGIFISSTSNVTICLITCLWSGWKLTLAMSFVYPILIAISKLSSKVQIF